MKDLVGKNVIIIGASGGIGSATAEVLAQAGANLILASRSMTNLDPVLNKVERIGPGKKYAIAADASQILKVEGLFKYATRFWGKVDAVFITSGTFKEVADTTDLPKAAEIYESMELSILRPVYNTALEFRRQAKRQSEPIWFVHVSSHVVDNLKLSGNWAYGTLKAGASHLVAMLQAEGLRATDIRPGFVDTPGNIGILDTEEKRRAVVQRDEIGKWLVEHFYDELPPQVQRFESGYKKD